MLASLSRLLPSLTIRIAALSLAIATVSAAPAPGYIVTMRIDMRGPIKAGWFDPKTEKVGVRGDTDPLTWDTSLDAVDPDGDGIYAATVPFAASAGSRQFVVYKFKVDGTANPNDGWENGADRPLKLDRRWETVSRAFDAPGPGYPHTLTGDIRRYPAFASKFVVPRSVTVLLPPGYGRSKARYPVLYMQDGQNLFDSYEAQRAEWRADETSLSLERSGRIEPIIIVGIASIPDHRIGDYTSTAIEDRSLGAGRVGGGARSYGRFLVEELKPFVDRTFRTRPDASNTALGGSSLGGLVTMDLGLEYPAVFGNLLVVSPSVWWDGKGIVKRVKTLKARPGSRVWLDIGSNESATAVSDARELRDALIAKGWTEGKDLQYVEIENGGHSEAAWADRFGRMLEFVFPRRR